MRLWSFRIAVAKLRPFDGAGIVRIAIVAAIGTSFLYGDYRLAERLFRAVATVEAASPFFAIGLLRNLLAMVFLVATVVLFSSALTAAIGSFFTDLDLDLYHAVPRSKLRIAASRWGKTLAQSATVIFVFILPLFVAFARTYAIPPAFYVYAALHLLLLLSIPVSLASTTIILLVRWFPVRRVNQIVATLAILVLTMAVVAFRMSRPERFFTDVDTDDLVHVLKSVELPSMDAYPSTAVADLMASSANRARASRISSSLELLAQGGIPASDGPSPLLRLSIPALAAFGLFLAVARAHYFRAFVRARESMAPVALGSALATRTVDRLLRRLDLQTQALVAKEVRLLARDVGQWSQLFMMAGLLFIYLYNIRILPIGGDARATVVAYANLGMAGFIISAMCLRFAYPSVSSEGRSFWLIQSAPISYRRLLLVKVGVYSAPLTFISLLLTSLANVMLEARATVWLFTLIGASLLALTLVSLGVGMGGFTPDFAAENPLQVGLSLGGFAYMAISLAYVGALMILMARPVARFLFRQLFGTSEAATLFATATPVVIAVTLSLVLMVFPLLVAERRLAKRH